MTTILSGGMIAGYLMIALFFFRFWVTGRDRLFVLFAAAFTLLAVQRFALSMTAETMENQTVFYLLRLAAFLVILFAIVDKNRR